MRTDHLHPAVVVASNRYCPLVKLADMPPQRVDASAADPGGPLGTTTGASATETRSLALAKTMRDAHPPGFCRASMSDHPAGAATHGDSVEPVSVAVYGSRAVADGAHPTIVTRRQVQPIPAPEPIHPHLVYITLRGCRPRGSTLRFSNIHGCQA